MRRSRAMRFAMLLAFVPQIAIAGAGFWSSSGPSGGVVYDVEINPATPTTLYASTRGGIFKSIDGGLSWARAQNGIVGSAGYNFRIVLDRDAPDTLYTFDASGRLYRTTDGAANWALTGYVLPTGVQAQDFADVPGSTTNLFLATSDFSGSATATGGLLRSTNAGASFAPAGTGLPAGRNFAAVAVDPTTPAVVLAGVDDFEHPSAGAQPAIYRSSDGGATWTSAFASPDPDFTPGVPAISFGPGLRVYASGEFATLLRSDDDGASWSNIGTNAQRVLAHPTLADTVFIANSQGFLRSTSGGTAPVVLNTGASPNATYTSTLAGAAPVPPFVNGIVADPAFPAAGTSLWLTGDGSGLLRSLDAAAGGAVTWTTAHEGLVATNVRALLAHPLGGGRVRVFQDRLFRGLDVAPAARHPAVRTFKDAVGFQVPLEFVVDHADAVVVHERRRLALDATGPRLRQHPTRRIQRGAHRLHRVRHQVLTAEGIEPDRRGPVQLIGRRGQLVLRVVRERLRRRIIRARR